MAALHDLLRRDRLDPEPRVRLFADFAEHFRLLVEFPPEATEGLTDEAYLKAVVDVLFRTREQVSGVGYQVSEGNTSALTRGT